MDSIDLVVAITIFFLMYISFQQLITSPEPIPYLYDPSFLCSSGSPGHWYVSDGIPGLGYAFRRCVLDNDRLDAFFSQLNSNTNQMKSKMGLDGKRLRLWVEDYYDGTIYYSFTQSINRPNIFRYEQPAVLNSSLVKIVMEVGY